MTPSKYKFLAGLHERCRANQVDPIWVGHDEDGRHFLLLKNRLGYRSRDPDLVLLTKPAASVDLPQILLPALPGVHSDTPIERMVRSHLDNLGYRARQGLDHLPGRPDFWLPSPHPLIIAVHSCRLHAHGCPLTAGDELDPAEMSARRAVDRKNFADWDDLGVPMIVVWGCSLTGSAALPDAQFSIRLEAAIQLGASCEIQGDWA